VNRTRILYSTILAAAAVAPGFSADVAVNPQKMPAIGTVDRRFQAYNIEMLEVTGGRFWKPYKDIHAATPDDHGRGATPAGMSASLYEYRPPIDLTNARLRKLAAALGPAYVRVSGTWANSTYFPDTDGPAPKTPPAGFNGVLTRAQWKGVIDFTRATHGELVTSFATSVGTRDAHGVWTPAQARAVLAYTKSLGGRIAAAEFMNEPNFAAIGGAPAGYDAAAYARDIAVFKPFLKETSPDTLFLGPGSVMEGGRVSLPMPGGTLHSEDVLRASGPVYDIFSFHIYTTVSQRCGGGGPQMAVTPATALAGDVLARADGIEEFYAGLRDRYEPGKPLWITETADAACGGNPWGSTFLDTFRYLDSHARLAQKGVQAIAHNTLASSDYGLLDEKTLAPRPDYWAALLWNKLMGTTVLKPDAPEASALHLYAQCMSGVPGGVTVLAINTSRSDAQTLTVPGASERYTLTAPELEGARVELNGKALALGADDSLPALAGVPAASGNIALAPASITFLAIRQAHNSSCH
jgi:hypothetical protein